MTRSWIAIVLLAFLAASALSVHKAAAQDMTLLNVSYDPTRELYEDVNRAFADSYLAETGKHVEIKQSHGGSGKQAHEVLDGLQADVVTLALGWDITALEKAGLIKSGWESRLPDNSSPYTSTIVFLVRSGNPRQLHDWPDLIKPDVKDILTNPKSGGGARWAFLAAWGQAAGAKPGSTAPLDEAKADDYVRSLYQHVPILDSGARGSTLTFAQKKVGDVLVSWENEAKLAQEEFPDEKFEIVYPSVSILAEPPVAVVDKVVDARGTRDTAEAYLKFLYTPAAQELIAQNHYRPRDKAVADAHAKELPPIPLFTLQQVAGSWANAQNKFFADGGLFDRIYSKDTH